MPLPDNTGIQIHFQFYCITQLLSEGPSTKSVDGTKRFSREDYTHWT